MKWIEWNPIGIYLSNGELLPKSYSIGLTKLTLGLLIPVGVLGIFQA